MEQVLSEAGVVSEQTFTEVNGMSVANGQWVSSLGRPTGDIGPGLSRESREVTLDNGMVVCFRISEWSRLI